MAKKKSKTNTKSSKAKEENKFDEEKQDFDFGGFPKDVKLTKNLGCGG